MNLRTESLHATHGERTQRYEDRKTPRRRRLDTHDMTGKAIGHEQAQPIKTPLSTIL